jgi:hypothetical protein
MLPFRFVSDSDFKLVQENVIQSAVIPEIPSANV